MNAKDIKLQEDQVEGIRNRLPELFECHFMVGKYNGRDNIRSLLNGNTKDIELSICDSMFYHKEVFDIMHNVIVRFTIENPERMGKLRDALIKIIEDKTNENKGTK